MLESVSVGIVISSANYGTMSSRLFSFVGGAVWRSRLVTNYGDSVLILLELKGDDVMLVSVMHCMLRSYYDDENYRLVVIYDGKRCVVEGKYRDNEINLGISSHPDTGLYVLSFSVLEQGEEFIKEEINE